MANDGASVTVTFDMRTDRGQQYGVLDCGFVFDGNITTPTKCFDGTLAASMTDVFGIGTGCTWVDDSHVVLKLGSFATVVPEMYIRLKEQRVRRPCCWPDGGPANLTSHGYVFIERPFSPLTPTAVVSADERLGACDDLILDAAMSTGGGGRKLDVRWSFAVLSEPTAGASNANGELDNLTRIIDAANAGNYGYARGRGDLRVRVPPAALGPLVQYEFSVEVESFYNNETFGGASHRMHRVGYPLPIVRLLGRRESAMPRARTMALYAEARGPKCGPYKDGIVDVHWFQYAGDLGVGHPFVGNGSIVDPLQTVRFDGNERVLFRSQSRNPLQLKLAPGMKPNTPYPVTLPDRAFTPGVTYKIGVMAVVRADSTVNNTATAEVQVYQDELRAVIDCGDRQVSAWSNITLDATLSYDPDNPTDE
jgi:hypothetical protein